MKILPEREGPGEPAARVGHAHPPFLRRAFCRRIAHNPVNASGSQTLSSGARSKPTSAGTICSPGSRS